MAYNKPADQCNCATCPGMWPENPSPHWYGGWICTCDCHKVQKACGWCGSRKKPLVQLYKEEGKVGGPFCCEKCRTSSVVMRWVEENCP